MSGPTTAGIIAHGVAPALGGSNGAALPAVGSTGNRDHEETEWNHDNAHVNPVPIGTYESVLLAPELYSNGPVPPYFKEIGTSILDAIDDDGSGGGEYVANGHEYLPNPMGYQHMDYVWNSGRSEGASGISVGMVQIASNPQAELYNQRLPPGSVSVAAVARTGVRPMQLSVPGTATSFSGPYSSTIAPSALVTAGPLIVPGQSLSEASPTVSKKRRIEETYDPEYWSAVNQEQDVNIDPEAPPTFRVLWNPTTSELTSTSKSLMDYLLSDFDKIELFLHTGVVPEVTPAADDENTRGSVSGQSMKRLGSSASAKASNPSDAGSPTDDYSQKRRKLGDEIRWEPKSVGVMLELNERFNVKQKDVSQILSTIRTSCFGILNMRELGAWQRINTKEQ